LFSQDVAPVRGAGEAASIAHLMTRSSSLARAFAPALQIRRAALGDLAALSALEQQVFHTDRLSRRSLRRLLQSPSAAVIVAEADDAALAGNAILLFRIRSALARLYSLAVTPPMAGRGVAARLLQEAEAVALDRGCRAVRLEVHETNHAAMARYRKSGYREFAHRNAYYEDGGAALRFEKWLVPDGDVSSSNRGLSARALTR
jgi:ribosomal protein S18 acetylase RimI-like enzyme